MQSTGKIHLIVDKVEAEIIRAALASHREKFAHAIAKAKRDPEHRQILVNESRATSKMLTTLDRVIFEAVAK